MSTAGVSGVSRGAASSAGQNGKVDLATIAASKALRVQREQADAMIGLIEQASLGGDKGRYVSVRA